MKSLLSVMASFLMLACGDSSSTGGSGGGGAAAEGGAPEGGASDGGGGAGDGVLTLEIAEDEGATVTCATFDGDSWGTATTAFEGLEVANQACALVAVMVEGEPEPYWITSRSFEGTIGDADLRHAISTAEAVIDLGSAPFELLDPDFAPLFEGTLVTSGVGGGIVEIRVE